MSAYRSSCAALSRLRRTSLVGQRKRGDGKSEPVRGMKPILVICDRAEPQCQSGRSSPDTRRNVTGYPAYGYGYSYPAYGYGTGYSYPAYGYGTGIVRRGLYAAAWRRWR